MTAGLAGADLANIINEAALLAGRANKEEVEPSDFKEAVERQIAGLEKKSRICRSENLETWPGLSQHLFQHKLANHLN